MYKERLIEEGTMTKEEAKEADYVSEASKSHTPSPGLRIG